VRLDDHKYAQKLYCVVYNVDDDGDTYTRGVLDMLETLKDQEQLALRYYYRNGYSYKRTSDLLNVNYWTGRNIIATAIRKLRHESRLRKISVKKIIEYYESQLKDTRKTIGTQNEEIKQLIIKMPDELYNDHKSSAILTRVSDLGLSTYTYNFLLRYNIDSIESLLKLESLDWLIVKTGFGLTTHNEIISKMRDYGHIDWANRIEADWIDNSNVPFSVYKNRLRSRGVGREVR